MIAPVRAGINQPGERGPARRWHRSVRLRDARELVPYMAELEEFTRLLQQLKDEIRLRLGPHKIAVKSGGKVIFLRCDEIEWVEAKGNNVVIHTGEGSHTLRETMAAMEERLSPFDFVRIHRSASVNAHKVASVEPWFTGEHVVRLESGKELTLTRKYRDSLN